MAELEAGDTEANRHASELIGKGVVTATDDRVGTVIGASDDTLFVEPSDRLLAGMSSWLCCPWDRYQTFKLDPAAIDRIERTKVVLKSD